MGRPKGSKVVPCPKCGERVVAVPGETGICTHCQTKVKFTQKLMKETAATKSAAPKKTVRKALPATPKKVKAVAAAPKRRKTK